MARDKRVSGLKKIAALFISLGPELSAKVMRLLPDEDIEAISAEMANTTVVKAEFQEQVLGEMMEMYKAKGYTVEGGVNFAREVLDRALGSAKAAEIMRKLTVSNTGKPFRFVKKIEPRQLAGVFIEEQPQTIALILSYLEPEQAAAVLSLLPSEQRPFVARRIATMDRVSPEVLAELEKVLAGRFDSFADHDLTAAGGVKSLVDILNRVDRATEKMIFEQLDRDDPALAEEIRKRLFVFEDVIMLDDSAIQRVVREIDSKELALALKGAGAEVSQRIYKNMSKRAAEMLKEDLEFMGPIRLREVEAAQARIVGIIRKLDEAGEIVIARGGEDAIIV